MKMKAQERQIVSNEIQAPNYTLERTVTQQWLGVDDFQSRDAPYEARESRFGG
jgi:hypothetical protein